MWINQGHYNGDWNIGYMDMLGDGQPYIGLYAPGSILGVDHWTFSYNERHKDNSLTTFDVLGLGSAGLLDTPIKNECLRVWSDMDAFDGQCPSELEAPDNVNAIATTPDAVALTWQDNSHDPQEDGFFIQRNPYHGDGIWHTVGTVTANTTSFTDTDSLSGHVEYTYRIGAYKD